MWVGYVSPFYKRKPKNKLKHQEFKPLQITPLIVDGDTRNQFIMPQSRVLHGILQEMTSHLMLPTRKPTSQGGALTGTPGAGQDTDEANVHGRNEEREKFSLLLNLIYSQISSDTVLVTNLSQFQLLDTSLNLLNGLRPELLIAILYST